jgi:hypothetical protein
VTGSGLVGEAKTAFEISDVAGASASGAAFARGLPHSGQNIAGSRIDAPHDAQRSEISGCMELLSIADCQLPI